MNGMVGGWLISVFEIWFAGWGASHFTYRHCPLPGGAGDQGRGMRDEALIRTSECDRATICSLTGIGLRQWSLSCVVLSMRSAKTYTVAAILCPFSTLN